MLRLKTRLKTQCAIMIAFAVAFLAAGCFTGQSLRADEGSFPNDDANVASGDAPASADSDQPTKQAVAESIRNDLEDAERIDGDNINVRVDKGLVTLSGAVECLLDKHLAARIAEQTRGVSAVLNQLIVRRSDRSDDAIREDVLKVLQINQSVPRSKITVDVELGRVALAGRVDSLAEKRIAENAAAGVRGVVQIENGLTVNAKTKRSDEELREEIAGLLVHSVYLDDADLRVDVEDQVARLSGAVASAAAKKQARRMAEIKGVVEVDLTDVSVNPSRLDPLQRKQRYAEMDDQQIRRSIERVLLADPIVFAQADQIAVDVRSGVVELHGTVGNLLTKRKAQSLVQDVVGVQRVVNELEVQYPDQPPANATIIEQVQAALLRSPYLLRRELRVHCQRGHVSLYGIVDSQLEKDVAGWLAGGIPGVVHVNNSLAIDNKSVSKSDQQIQQALERKLKFRLFDAANEIDVTVEDGVAVIRGEVDTWRQWQAAMDLALEAGSRHPHNLLDVRFHPPHGGSRIYVPE